MAKFLNVGVSTAITIAQFASMAFLIICCVTAPVFKQIGLSKTDGIVFGTFGYCEQGSCSSASASYHPEQLATSASWKMGTSAREALGKILVIMPVAAGLAFLSMLGSFISLFGAIGTSGAAFVINLLLSVIAFAGSALMCIVVFLLFYPNITWCGWLLIPAAAVNLVCIPLTFLSYSLAPSKEQDSDAESEFTGRQEITSLGQPSSKGPFEEDVFYNSSKKSILEKPAYPEFYKGPEIATSTTLNSGTTDSKSDREKLLSDKPLPNPVLKTAYGTAKVMRPVTEDVENDFSFENNAKETQPYSAIAGPQRDDRASMEISAPAVSAMNGYRDPSSTSSFYSERDQRVSRQNTLNTTDLRPSSALIVDSDARKEKSNNDVLQHIIDNAIHEDDEEFIKQQTIDPSERPHLDEDDGIQDDDSDFTSVSQRGINPNYVPLSSGVKNTTHPPQVMKTHVPRTTNYPSVPLGNTQGNAQGRPFIPLDHQRAPMNHPRMVAPLRVPHVYQPQQAAPRGYVAPQQGYRPNNAPTASETVLTTNPDFMIPGVPSGGLGAKRAQRQIYASPPHSNPSTNYKPAYKKRLPRHNMPPASMTREGPYSGMM
ncbi:LAQU0S02e03136g1_1 [Lachancea quebecensis]|uniref:LAQU0S02e03136g1_1 n=1 Tax=Lachancea quebecensis TaxID=1654605 RepID=A0A0P1KNC9_9SACH|nr:LAQU0S02e03136g1_1 [Lachancea quebecensis]